MNPTLKVGDLIIVDQKNPNLKVDDITPEQLRAIDFNNNGKPDSDEALTLLKYVVGLISSPV